MYRKIESVNISFIIIVLLIDLFNYSSFHKHWLRYQWQGICMKFAHCVEYPPTITLYILNKIVSFLHNVKMMVTRFQCLF